MACFRHLPFSRQKCVRIRLHYLLHGLCLCVKTVGGKNFWSKNKNHDQKNTFNKEAFSTFPLYSIVSCNIFLYFLGQKIKKKKKLGSSFSICSIYISIFLISIDSSFFIKNVFIVFYKICLYILSFIFVFPYLFLRTINLNTPFEKLHFTTPFRSVI